MTHLTTLDLSYNDIEDISSLSNLIHMKELNLENNKVVDISALSNLIYMKELNLEHNNISDINAIKDFTSLTNLNVKHNDMTIDFNTPNDNGSTVRQHINNFCDVLYARGNILTGLP